MNRQDIQLPPYITIETGKHAMKPEPPYGVQVLLQILHGGAWAVFTVLFLRFLSN